MDLIFVLILFLSGILSAIGVGGGSIFVILITMLTSLELKEAQAYNLILFFVAGLTVTFKNIYDKKFDKKLFLKFIFLTIAGAILGVYLSSVLPEENVKKYFFVFLIIIGIYEIFSSLIKIIKEKILLGERR